MSIAQTAMQPAPAKAGRAEVSVFWRPGCSSCLKVKEFVEESGIPFESIDITAKTDQIEVIMGEIFAAGLRSIPVVRKGSKYVYAQSLEDVATLLGVERNHTILPNEVLFERWEETLNIAYKIIEKFPEDTIEDRVIPIRGRTIKELAVHIFQIPVGFMTQMDEGELEIKTILAYLDPAIVTKDDMLAHHSGVHNKLRAWLKAKKDTIPVRVPTYYGEQETAQVIERAVWHCLHHARQLDIVAAGRLGAEIEVHAGLHEGLPMPKRLWA